jgi:integrase
MRRSKGPRLYLREPRRPGGAERWVILDSDATGRAIEISTGASRHSRAEAEKIFGIYLGKKHTPSFGGGHPSEVLIADVLAFYAEGKPVPARANNLATSIVCLGEFFVGKRVSDLTPKLCTDYVQWRIHRGDARGSNKWKQKAPTPRLLKTTTARNDLIVLDAAQRYCWRNHKLTQFVPITKPPASKARLRFLSTSEAARLLAAALGWDQHGRRHHKRINRHLARFVLIGLYTGTRRDRITRLQWVENLGGGWIDLDRGILHRKSKAEFETKKRAPSVPLADAPGANALWAHLRRWRKLTARYVIEHNGSPIHGVFKGFEGACRLAGLNYDGQPADDRVTPHTLRHTCVSWALAEGRSPLQVGQYAGMTAAMVEKTYAHTNEALQRETANVIGRRNIPGRSQARPMITPIRA